MDLGDKIKKAGRVYRHFFNMSARHMSHALLLIDRKGEKMDGQNEIKKEASDANAITREYYDGLLIEQRLIGAVEASLETDVFGKRFSTPIMMGAFSMLPSFGDGRERATLEYARVIKKLNMVNWIGMMSNDETQDILDIHPDTIRIVKPFADKDKVFSQIAYAQEHGALAVGMDIDHIFGSGGKYDIVNGEQMGPQTAEDISEYVRSTDLPFVVKGVLSVRDAAICAECGVKGIMVSHHHGRLPYAIPPVALLESMRREFGNSRDILIFADCGIDTGADAFKAIASGADAVSIGRTTLTSLIQDGKEGLETYLRSMNEELAMIMGFTGAANVGDISQDMLHRKDRI